MKNIKFMMIAFFAILLGASVTSCNSSEPSQPIYEGVVTVESSMGVATSLRDDFTGYTLIPSNMDALKYSTTTGYATRAWIYYQLAEGEVITQGKTRYNITITTVLQDLVGKEFCDPSDLEHKPGAPFSSISNAWGTSGYLTAAFTTGYNQATLSLDLFDMYIDVDKTSGSTLYVRLNQDEVITSPSGTVNILYSFKIPTKSQIESLKVENPNFNLTYLTNDSVNVVVVANQASSSDLESKAFKVKIPN
ncbi:MAG: hypothetical protein ACK5M3_16325 [Dysgonomonas sp.]